MNSNIDELVTLKCEIESSINSVSDEVLRELLEHRYIEGQTWEEVAESMNYSLRQVYRLYPNAIDVIECHYKM